MYYCEKCRRFVKNTWSSKGEPLCEFCGSDDMEEAYKCPICGEWGLDRYACDWCRSEAESHIKAFVKKATRKEKMAWMDVFNDIATSLWVNYKIAEEKENEI